MVKKKGKNDILNRKEACKLLRCALPTLNDGLSTKREAGKIYAKKVGCLWRIQRKDIYQYLNGVENKGFEDEVIEDDVLNREEACKLLRISMPSLEKILSEERVPGKIYGRKFKHQHWKIQRKEIYRYLNEEE